MPKMSSSFSENPLLFPFPVSLGLVSKWSAVRICGLPCERPVFVFVDEGQLVGVDHPGLVFPLRVSKLARAHGAVVHGNSRVRHGHVGVIGAIRWPGLVGVLEAAL